MSSKLRNKLTLLIFLFMMLSKGYSLLVKTLPSQRRLCSSSFHTRVLRPPVRPSNFNIRYLQPLYSTLNSDPSIKRTKIRNILVDADASGSSSASSPLVGKELLIQGWVKTIRDQKQFSFIEVNDGSTGSNLQIIANNDIASYSQVQQITTGAAVEIYGTLVPSMGKNQKYELQAKQVAIVGPCPAENYPLQKKKTSQEYLRSIAHLRPRTNTISAVARIRSALAFATHEFFQKEGFTYVQTPLITSSDCEGAGEMFHVTTFPIDTPDRIPSAPLNKNTTEQQHTRQADFTKDFFGKPTYLTVSGQLSGETYACALGDIYTFGPTFRAEKSQTTRHLAEFHMIEPEMAFTNYHEAMDNAESYVKYVINYVMKNPNNYQDLLFFNKFYDKNLLQRLNDLIAKPFNRLLYSDAVTLLQKEIAKDPSKWVYPNVTFGSDLQTEHERWLAEKHFQSCVFIYNYPRAIKSFYMKDSLHHENTVDSFDLLVPGVGELIGGSQREDNYNKLMQKIQEFGLNSKDYEWYLDLRRYGSVPHSGYGLGFERLVCYVTGIENIREAIAYPRFYGSAEF